MNILLTGITGFVGRAVARRLLQDGHRLRAAVRRNSPGDFDDIEVVKFDQLEDHDWSTALERQDVVVHCAARVHVMNEQSQDPLSEFRRVNVEGTLNLARSAARVGVKRFVFISSIKVNGEGTLPGKLFFADSVVSPLDPYGISKREAEEQLLALADVSGMEVAIIRPVLVYGPGVKANFLSMMGWLERGIPLPFGAIHNKRSMVALDNLVDLISICVLHPAAANQIFLVSDGEDLSTTQLLQRTANALGRRAHLIPVPAWILILIARLFGKSAVAQRLCGSLQVDIQKTRLLLGWTPPMSVDQALSKTARNFLERR
ncbi:UDP-glucose 4-epimerase family protein [Pseudomonas sp. HTZ2]|uniref:UDP-glucose 4-epimerase family protein n=1 Tax=Pseudomonas sp. HTZ2 TaxID=3075220 RepID=UPI0029588BC5|nr:SDR family oxidoreductase [Pseudomonas sp. HTZ2]